MAGHALNLSPRHGRVGGKIGRKPGFRRSMKGSHSSPGSSPSAKYGHSTADTVTVTSTISPSASLTLLLPAFAGCATPNPDIAFRLARVCVLSWQLA